MNLTAILTEIDAASAPLFGGNLFGNYAAILELCVLSICLLRFIGITERRWELDSKKDLFVPLLIPGIIVHELSHMAVCTLFGIKTSHLRVNLTSRGGFINIPNPAPLDSNPLVAFLVAIAPILGGLGVLYGCIILIHDQANPILIFLGVWIGLGTLCYFNPSILDLKLFGKRMRRPRTAVLTLLWMGVCMIIEPFIASHLSDSTFHIPFIHWWIWIGLIWISAAALSIGNAVFNKAKKRNLSKSQLKFMEEVL